ncbi:MAG: DNA-binding response regulator [Phenylobacterium zucineum]|nr:MAG: DNA-binding response regulator [Phenylobacterium zucineum]
MDRDPTRSQLLFVGRVDPDRTELFKRLRGVGYDVHGAADGAGLPSSLRQRRFDLIVLDLDRRGADGFALCREIRHVSEIPIILLTTGADAVDRILGLELGADDCLAQPFEPQELLARIRSVLRRANRTIEPPPPAAVRGAAFGGWSLDFYTRRLCAEDGREETLSTLQCRLLQALIERVGQPLSRNELIACGAAAEGTAASRAVDVQIARLRRKLGPSVIQTVRGDGYAVTARIELLWDDRRVW